MADKLAYVVDGSGNTQAVPDGDLPGEILAGSILASPRQVEDFKKQQELQEKFGTPLEQAKTVAEGAAQSLTLGTSTIAEKALFGKEGIEGRQKVNPGMHTIGELTGAVAPLVFSGGASSLAAPSLIAKAGEGAAALLPEAVEGATALGRVGLSAARSAVTAGTEGALYGLGHVVHEKALGNPNLTAQSAIEEVGLSGLLGLGVGATGGILSGLTREATGGELGKKLAEWAHGFEGKANLKAAGAAASDLKAAGKNIGQEELNKIGRESGELGLTDGFTTPSTALERSKSLMESSGQKMGKILEEADTGGAAPAAFEDIETKVRDNVLSKMEESPFREGAAQKISETLGKYESRYAGRGEEAGLSFRDLHSLRKDIDDELYGLRGNMDAGVNYYKRGLHEVRSIVSDELNQGLEKAGLGSEEWKQAAREYQVAATVAKIADKAITRRQGAAVVPLTALISGGAGLVSGGPLGAGALGLGSFLAKKYGAGVMGTGARALREFIEKDGAEEVANRTAEMIAAERAAGSGVGAGIAEKWGRAVESLEPVGNLGKEATREQIKDRIAGEGSTAPEAVAALSQLQAANQRVQDRVNEMAGRVVSGKRVAEGTLAAAASHAVNSIDGYEKHLEQVHQLAGNADLMQQHLTKQTSDMSDHAPDTAQAVALAVSRAASFYSAKFPPKQKVGPLGPTLKPNNSDVFRLNQTKNVLDKPSRLLKHAANGTLTPMQVEAVGAVFPERLQQMQQAILEAAASRTEPIPYKSRLMMSMLAGQPLDGTTTPQSIMAAQAVYNMPSAKSQDNQTGPGAMKSTQTGLAKLNISSRAETPGQASDSRRRNA